jgi:uncharacterized protein YegP (UPF0339 family)
MSYKIRVFDIGTNNEAISVNEVFESKEAAETAIKKMKSTYPNKYDYVKVPVLQR